MCARGAIENLLHRCSLAYDINDTGQMAAAYAEDATLTIRIAGGDLIGPFEGKGALQNLLAESRAAQTYLPRHVITNLIIWAEDGKTASTSCYLILHTVLEGELRILTTGRYDDELLCQTDGTWRIVKRHLELDKPY